MCIRDRAQAAPELRLAERDQFLTWIAEAKNRLLTPTAPEPVSYTHLRAHETVLDLVCRLLLEKKKKHV